jgi:hypothetical protein
VVRRRQLAVGLLLVFLGAFAWRPTGSIRGGSLDEAEYASPGLGPAEAGTSSTSARARDVVATLVDLAVRGTFAWSRCPRPSIDGLRVSPAQRVLGDPDIQPFELFVLAGSSARTGTSTCGCSR